MYDTQHLYDMNQDVHDRRHLYDMDQDVYDTRRYGIDRRKVTFRNVVKGQVKAPLQVLTPCHPCTFMYTPTFIYPLSSTEYSVQTTHVRVWIGLLADMAWHRLWHVYRMPTACLSHLYPRNTFTYPLGGDLIAICLWAGFA